MQQQLASRGLSRAWGCPAAVPRRNMHVAASSVSYDSLGQAHFHMHAACGPDRYCYYILKLHEDLLQFGF